MLSLCGAAVGFAIGAGEGAVVGNDIGLSVGSATGAGDGAVVGSAIGLGVGSATGAALVGKGVGLGKARMFDVAQM